MTDVILSEFILN